MTELAYVSHMLTGDRYESMIATLKMIDKDYGGVSGYLKSRCQFTDQDLTRIRDTLVAKEKPTKMDAA